MILRSTVLNEVTPLLSFGAVPADAVEIVVEIVCDDVVGAELDARLFVLLIVVRYSVDAPVLARSQILFPVATELLAGFAGCMDPTGAAAR